MTAIEGRRLERAAAWVSLALVGVGSIAVLWLRLTRPEGLVVDSYNPAGVFTVAMIGFAAVGAHVVHRRPGNRMGWLFLAFSLSVVPGDLAFEYGIRALSPATGPLPLGAVSTWVYGWTQAVAAAPFAVILLFFPSGRPPTRRWHLCTALMATGVLVSLPLAVALWDDRGARLLHVGDDPAGLGVASSLFQVQYVLLIAAIAGGGAAIVRRLWKGDPDERQRVKWVAAAAGVVVFTIVVDLAPVFVGGESPTSTDLAIALAVLAVPVASGIGILRHRLFDIDLVIRRSLLYGAVSAAIAATYLGAAAVAGVAAGDRVPLSVAVGITIVTLAVFQPVRHRVQQAAARRILGERLSRYEAVARLGEALEHALDPGQLAPPIAAAVRNAVGVSWVRVSFIPGESTRAVVTDAADTGEAPVLTISLRHQQRDLGVIACGPKIDGAFTREDEELLKTLGRQVALAVHNAGLAEELAARLQEIEAQANELRESRGRLVRAQDDERRRIERNIHDGVQQEIVALLAKLRLARNQLARGGGTAEETLAEVQADTAILLDDLRELSQGIHPSVLVDSGLLAAVESKIARLPIGVRIDATRALRAQRFAPELEAAAYFVVSEALANVVKHAAATSACVRLAAGGDSLEVQIVDNGVGFIASGTTGSGLRGLRDRVEAVGGQLRINSSLGHGTRVTAVLPTAVPDNER